jgi:hypothetical protein
VPWQDRIEVLDRQQELVLLSPDARDVAIIQPRPVNGHKLVIDDEFTIFWKACPRKKGMGRARVAFAKAREKASFETIMAGIKRYAAHEFARTDNPGLKYTQHPSTWLNGECWNDEYSSAQNSDKAATARLRAAAVANAKRYGL